MQAKGIPLNQLLGEKPKPGPKRVSSYSEAKKAAKK